MAESTCNCGNCSACCSHQTNNVKVAPAGPRGKSLYELWLDNGNQGTIEDFVRASYSYLKTRHRVHLLDIGHFELNEVPTLKEAKAAGKELGARSGDTLIYETEMSINNETRYPVVYEWKVVENLEVVLDYSPKPVYLRALLTNEVAPGFSYCVDNLNGLRPHEWLVNTVGSPVELYINPSVDYDAVGEEITNLQQLILNSNASQSANVTLVTDVSTFDPVLAFPETPNQADFQAIIDTLPSGTTVNNIIYTSPIGRVITLDVMLVGTNNIVSPPNYISYIYQGPLTPAQYATFRPESTFWVDEDDVLYAKRINANGGVINKTVYGADGSGVNASGVTTAQLNAMANVLRAERQAEVAAVTQAYTDAIDNAPDAKHTEIVINGNAPAAGFIPVAVSSLDGNQDDSVLVNYLDVRVFYQATPWVEKSRASVSSSGVSQAYVDNAISTVNSVIAAISPERTIGPVNGYLAGQSPVISPPGEKGDYFVAWEAVSIDGTVYPAKTVLRLRRDSVGGIAEDYFIDAIKTAMLRNSVVGNDPSQQLIGGSGNANKIGWYTSPTTDIKYEFALNIGNPNADSFKNISDVDGPEHFLFLDSLNEVPYDQSVAHYYDRTTAFHQKVLIGSDTDMHIFYTTIGMTLTQVLVKPTLDSGATLNSVTNGWRYGGIR